MVQMQVAELASLFKSKQVTSVELVEIFTARMQRHFSLTPHISDV